jgi:hypothetical protein
LHQAPSPRYFRTNILSCFTSMASVTVYVRPHNSVC